MVLCDAIEIHFAGNNFQSENLIFTNMVKTHCHMTKANILLRRKIIALGPCVGLEPSTQEFSVTYTNMLVSKNAKTPTPNLKFALPSVKSKRKSVEYRLRWVPNTNFLRWPCTCFCVDFMYPTQTRFQWNMGLKKNMCST